MNNLSFGEWIESAIPDQVSYPMKTRKLATENVLQEPYIATAKELAEYLAGIGWNGEEELNLPPEWQDKLVYIRDQSMRSTNVYKGDYVVLALLQVARSSKSSVSVRPALKPGTGRHLAITDETIQRIFELHYGDKVSMSKGARFLGISPYTYRSVVQESVTQPKDKERIAFYKKLVLSNQQPSDS